ncbi:MULTISPECIES: STAS domain-containing protein [unclassified Niallia]|uniref:STAS domain-containing protein n=1 Tax=unclassified Niallia TaxID=2837522 RepID=UPI001EDB85A0|nr:MULTISPECIES: STAS domain-containing protein [unclassified Niallia]MDL0435640.1 STAS domain-containing protein [Niallia sp. SS-2023]UPO88059.1 STAS domain-containing protein [Niallia sp. Man26]
MQKNEKLYKYFLENADRLTDDWYANLDRTDPNGVYASEDPEIIKTLKKQNNDFHYYLAKVFIEEEEKFLEEFREWVVAIASDKEHLETPIHFIIREFIRTREQYFQLVEEFKQKNDIPEERITIWNRSIVRIFDIVILQFTEQFHENSIKQLRAQQEMINELSSPVILLSENRALLPLVGDIDTARAAAILENTIKQCAEKRVTQLFIDLSGVIIIDTMVAHQIFQLINGLSLIGVHSTLSGIRPEIATTAIQLGLSFNDISIASTLSKAIAEDKEFFNE